LDAVTLWENGEISLAIGYVATSLILSFAVLTAMLVLTHQWG